MRDDREKGEGRAAAPAKNPRKDPRKDSRQKASREDRLKLALRENLKRRKSQAKGRSEFPGASSLGGDASPYRGGKKPGE
jgi:hypothetical protein